MADTPSKIDISVRPEKPSGDNPFDNFFTTLFGSSINNLSGGNNIRGLNWKRDSAAQQQNQLAEAHATMDVQKRRIAIKVGSLLTAPLERAMQAQAGSDTYNQAIAEYVAVVQALNDGNKQGLDAYMKFPSEGRTFIFGDKKAPLGGDITVASMVGQMLNASGRPDIAAAVDDRLGGKLKEMYGALKTQAPAPAAVSRDEVLTGAPDAAATGQSEAEKAVHALSEAVKKIGNGVSPDARTAVADQFKTAFEKDSKKTFTFDKEVKITVPGVDGNPEVITFEKGKIYTRDDLIKKFAYVATPEVREALVKSFDIQAAPDKGRGQAAGQGSGTPAPGAGTPPPAPATTAAPAAPAPVAQTPDFDKMSEHQRRQYAQYIMEAGLNLDTNQPRGVPRGKDSVPEQNDGKFRQVTTPNWQKVQVAMGWQPTDGKTVTPEMLRALSDPGMQKKVVAAIEKNTTVAGLGAAPAAVATASHQTVEITGKREARPISREEVARIPQAETATAVAVAPLVSAEPTAPAPAAPAFAPFAVTTSPSDAFSAAVNSVAFGGAVGGTFGGIPTVEQITKAAVRAPVRDEREPVMSAENLAYFDPMKLSAPSFKAGGSDVEQAGGRTA